MTFWKKAECARDQDVVMQQLEVILKHVKIESLFAQLKLFVKVIYEV